MEHNYQAPLSVDDAARFLAVSPRTVRRLIDRGEFGAVRIRATLAIPIEGMPVALRRCFEADPSQRLSPLHDAAARLGCSPDELRARTADGEFQPVRVGRSLRWPRAENEGSLRVESHR